MTKIIAHIFGKRTDDFFYFLSFSFSSIVTTCKMNMNACFYIAPVIMCKSISVILLSPGNKTCQQAETNPIKALTPTCPASYYRML